MAVIPGFIPEGASGVAPFLDAATLYGGRASGGDLTLSSTSHSTKGKLVFGNSVYDEVNNRLGIGTTSPNVPLVVSGGLAKSVGTAATGLGFITDYTGGKSIAVTSGTLRAAILFDDTGSFSIQARSNADVLTGTAAAGSTLFEITNGGFVGLGTAGATPTQRLDIYAGNLQFSNTTSISKQTQSLFTPSWVDSTNASRKARVTWSIYDTSAREAMRVEASGSAPLIGFLGANAVARQSLNAAATDASTTQTLVNQIRSALISFGLCS